MNLEKCAQLHNELDLLIKNWCDEHNITFQRETCRYEGNNMTYKCNLIENTANCEIADTEWDIEVANNWLKETGYTYNQVKGKCFKTERGWAKIIRFKYGSKFPWIIEDHPVNARRNARPCDRVNQEYLLNFAELTAPF